MRAWPIIWPRTRKLAQYLALSRQTRLQRLELAPRVRARELTRRELRGQLGLRGGVAVLQLLPRRPSRLPRRLNIAPDPRQTHLQSVV